MLIDLDEAEEFITYSESERKLIIENLDSPEVETGQFIIIITLIGSGGSAEFEIRIEINEGVDNCQEPPEISSQVPDNDFVYTAPDDGFATFDLPSY